MAYILVLTVLLFTALYYALVISGKSKNNDSKQDPLTGRQEPTQQPAAPDQKEIEKRQRLDQKRKDFRKRFTEGFPKALTNITPTYVFIDFETSDLPPEYTLPKNDEVHLYPYIVQAAALVFNSEGELIDEFASIIKTPPEVKFNQEAVSIHKISKAKSQAEGVEITVFFDFIKRYLLTGVCLVAHNVQFDNLFLRIEAKRNRVRLARYKKYCTMKETTRMVGIWNYSYTRYKYPKLKELVAYTFFDGEHVKNAANFHDAATDIKLCAMCFFELKLHEDLVDA